MIEEKGKRNWEKSGGGIAEEGKLKGQYAEKNEF
jgi:hypothetical protein